MVEVVVVGGSEETRLLLRGLLRLYRHRIVGDGPTFDRLATPPDGARPTVAVIDLPLDDAGTSRGLAALAARHPGLRAILLAADGEADLDSRARAHGFAAVVRRPFAVHELIDAVAPPGAERPDGART